MMNLITRDSHPSRTPSTPRWAGWVLLTSVLFLSSAALAQPTGLLGYDGDNPVISYDAGTVTYSNAAELLSVTGVPEFIITDTDAWWIDPPAGLSVNVRIDSNGVLLGGAAGDDLVLQGTTDIDTDGDSVPEHYSGVLLTGEVQSYGFQNDGTVDKYDFLFTPTGGTLVAAYGPAIYVQVISEGSTFNGVFTADFHGGAKGNVCVPLPLNTTTTTTSTTTTTEETTTTTTEEPTTTTTEETTTTSTTTSSTSTTTTSTTTSTTRPTTTTSTTTTTTLPTTTTTSTTTSTTRPTTTTTSTSTSTTTTTRPTTTTTTTSTTTTTLPQHSFVTYTPGGWGASPSGNNAAALLKKNFSRVYPGGSVTIGGTKTLKFTSAAAIQKFLPQGGTAGVLTSSATNPTTSAAGNFAGQVLALRLSVDFSAAGITKSGLSSGVYVGPGPASLRNQTVGYLLNLANQVLGGNLSALPTGVSLSDLNSVISNINLSWDNGVGNGNVI